jgi:hypothetical protein
MTVRSFLRNSVYTILMLLACASCGDIQTAFIIREDSSATIRYTYLANRNIDPREKSYVAAIASVDSQLRLLTRDHQITGYKISPIYNDHVLRLDVRVDHYREIDRVHRQLFKIANKHNETANILGINPDMRDSIVFDTSGDSIRIRILNWIPDSILNKETMTRLAEDIYRFGLAADSAALRKGGKDSIRAAKALQRKKVITPLLDSLAALKGAAWAREYGLPRRRYTLNAPFMLHAITSHELTSLKIDREFASITWHNLHLDQPDATDALGLVPAQWFKLESPSTYGRSQWRRYFNWCDECENGFIATDRSQSGIQVYKKQDTTTLLVNCGRDSLGPRTLIATKGYSEELGNFANTDIQRVYHARADSDSINEWISDMLIGDIIIDTARAELRITQKAGDHGIRLFYALGTSSPGFPRMEILNKKGVWDGKLKPKVSFSWDRTQNCSDPHTE